MTNYEWLLKQNEEIIKECLIDGVAVKNNGDITRCGKTTCGNCIFGRNVLVCSEAQRDWLNAERNPYTIPLDTPIDTKVLVSNNGLEWLKRYFAGFSKNESQPYRAFSDGVSNWSKDENFGICEWEYCKLAEGSEE